MKAFVDHVTSTFDKPLRKGGRVFGKARLAVLVVVSHRNLQIDIWKLENSSPR